MINYYIVLTQNIEEVQKDESKGDHVEVIMSGDKKGTQEVSSPLSNFDFPKPPPVTSTPLNSTEQPKSDENIDYDIPKPLYSNKMEIIHHTTEERTYKSSPHHFMVNNKETGLEDVYAKPISPKPSSKVPPPPPPRANPPKQKTLKFQTNEDSSNSIYDNPISYKLNGNTEEKETSNHNVSQSSYEEKTRGRNQNQDTLPVQNLDENVTSSSNENVKNKGKSITIRVEVNDEPLKTLSTPSNLLVSQPLVENNTKGEKLKTSSTKALVPPLLAENNYNGGMSG